MTEPQADGPSTEQLRIAAIQAVVAAGLAPSTGRQQEAADEEAPVVSTPLPDWTDPPTGQVPRVLLDPDRRDDELGERTARTMKGPVWRQDAADWDDEADLGLAFLLDDEEEEDGSRAPVVAGREPFGFEDELFAELDVAPRRFEWPESREAAAVTPGESSGAADTASPRQPRPFHEPMTAEPVTAALVAPATTEETEEEVVPFGPLPPERRDDRRGRRRKEHARAAKPHRRDPLVATLTGLGIGVVALVCFLLGAPTTLALVAVVLTIATGEALATCRRAGRRPAGPIAFVAVPMIVVGCYLWGAAALSWVLAGALVLATVWYLAAGARAAPVRDLGATFFLACWVGVPGAFAGLLLAPARFPHRHGVAFLFAVVALTVAHDVGSYVVGGRFGRRRLAPRVSPHKTWEGIAGGTVATFVVALAGLSQLHPLTLGSAAILAVLVSVLAPLGDLAESLVKRDLAVKDMGRLLPAHGGLFDRVDAMLFVLPAAYGLFRLAHLG